MKKVFLFAFTAMVAVLLNNKTFAQGGDRRNKIQMVINFGGKTISTDLNSLSTSLSRTPDDEPPVPAVSQDTSKKSKAKFSGLSGNICYLSMDAKQIDPELLKVFSKKETRFDGSITITDTYGKNATRIVKFKQASLYSYSDQFSSDSYGEGYGSTAISIVCKEISINGITIEQ